MFAVTRKERRRGTVKNSGQSRPQTDPFLLGQT